MTVTILSLSTGLSEDEVDRLTRHLRRDLSETGISASLVPLPPRPGEKGDVFSLGQLALDLVTGGAVVALIDCLKAYIQRDRTLSFKVERPDGFRLDVTSHNVASAEVRAALEALGSLK
jgi:Effector Associated Constant Component 1